MLVTPDAFFILLLYLSIALFYGNDIITVSKFSWALGSWGLLRSGFLPTVEVAISSISILPPVIAESYDRFHRSWDTVQGWANKVVSFS